MKNFLIIAILSLFAFSCDFNDQPVLKNPNQEWDLSGYEKASDDLVAVSDSTYNYVLQPDGAFTKTVGKYTLNGTYKSSTIDGIQHFDFMYDVNKSLLIHSCLPDVEQFYVNNKGQMVGTWDACDGIRFYFNKK